jgi:hypothetical protein
VSSGHFLRHTSWFQTSGGNLGPAVINPKVINILRILIIWIAAVGCLLMFLSFVGSRLSKHMKDNEVDPFLALFCHIYYSPQSQLDNDDGRDETSLELGELKHEMLISSTRRSGGGSQDDDGDIRQADCEEISSIALATAQPHYHGKVDTGDQLVERLASKLHGGGLDNVVHREPPAQDMSSFRRRSVGLRSMVESVKKHGVFARRMSQDEEEGEQSEQDIASRADSPKQQRSEVILKAHSTKVPTSLAIPAPPLSAQLNHLHQQQRMNLSKKSPGDRNDEKLNVSGGGGENDDGGHVVSMEELERLADELASEKNRARCSQLLEASL